MGTPTASCPHVRVLALSALMLVTCLAGLCASASAAVRTVGNLTLETTRQLQETVPGKHVMPVASADGSKVAFISDASPGSLDSRFPSVTARIPGVYVRNLTTGETKLVSLSQSGQPARGQIYAVAISPAGDAVAYSSDANDLVPNDTNGTTDVFAVHLASGDVKRANTTGNGTQTHSGYHYYDVAISNDDGNGGRYVAFDSDAKELTPQTAVAAELQQVFVKDLRFGGVRLASANASGTPGALAPDERGMSFGSRVTQIAADGNRVLFESTSSNLVAGDTNGEIDIFIKDLANRTVQRVSTNAIGAEANGSSQLAQMSADGRWVVFMSSATNLSGADSNHTADIFRKDTQTGAVTLVSATASGAQGSHVSTMPTVSDNGNTVAFIAHSDDLLPDDTNDFSDLLVKNLVTGNLARVQRGAQAPDGHTLNWPRLSSNGRRVFFHSEAQNLFPNDSNTPGDVFKMELLTGEIKLMSGHAASLRSANSYSSRPSLSTDGRYVAFESAASDLASNDTNSDLDVFVKDRQTGMIRLISRQTDGTQFACANSPRISPDGAVVTFSAVTQTSDPFCLPPTGGFWMVDLRNGTTKRVDVRGNNSGPPISTSWWGLQMGSVGNEVTDGSGQRHRYVPFVSGEQDLVSFPVSTRLNGYVKDLVTGEIKLVSSSAQGQPQQIPPNGFADGVRDVPSVSPDGRVSVFSSDAVDLVPGVPYQFQGHLYEKDLTSGAIRLLPPTPPPAAGTSSFYILRSVSNLDTAGARTALFERYVYGSGGGGAISGHLVTMNLTSGATQVVAQFQTESTPVDPGMDQSGRYVTFTSGLNPTNDPGVHDIQVYVTDLQTGDTVLVSRSDVPPGQAARYAFTSVISGDGSTVAFVAPGDDWFSYDRNNASDIFTKTITGPIPFRKPGKPVISLPGAKPELKKSDAQGNKVASKPLSAPGQTVRLLATRIAANKRLGSISLKLQALQPGTVLRTQLIRLFGKGQQRVVGGAKAVVLKRGGKQVVTFKLDRKAQAALRSQSTGNLRLLVSEQAGPSAAVVPVGLLKLN